jgi:hypothetical protein
MLMRGPKKRKIHSASELKKISIPAEGWILLISVENKLIS